MKFTQIMNQKEKLSSIDPIAVLKHLQRFSRDMSICPPHLNLQAKVKILLDSLTGQAKTMTEKFYHDQSPIWYLQSMPQVYQFIRDYFVSDIVNQNLILKYRDFTLSQNDNNLKVFLTRKYNLFLLTQNISELPPPDRNSPGCLFYTFTHSLLESVKENRQFLEKLSEVISYFSHYSQIERFFQTMRTSISA